MTTIVQLGKDRYHLHQEMEIWCSKHINYNPPYKNWVASEPKSWEGLGTWAISSMFGSTFFYFKNESDATMFLLRWS